MALANLQGYSSAKLEQALADIKTELHKYAKIIEMNKGRIRLATNNGNKEIAEKLEERVADYEAKVVQLQTLKHYAENMMARQYYTPDKIRCILEEILVENLAEIGGSKYAKI